MRFVEVSKASLALVTNSKRALSLRLRQHCPGGAFAARARATMKRALVER